jgi:hypothetical protein
VAVKSTIRILSASSVGSRRGRSCGQVTTIICLPVSLFHRLLLSAGLPSTRMRSLSLLWSVPSLKGVDGVRSRCQLPRWNRHHRLNGRSILLPRCGCDGSMQSPASSLLGEGRPDPPPPLKVVWYSSVESSIIAHHEDGGLL